MEQVDFTKMDFDEAVKTAMKEFGLEQTEAEELINIIQGGEADDMNITTKAGNSAGVKKGWLTRVHGGMASYQNKRRNIVRGVLKKGLIGPYQNKRRDATRKILKAGFGKKIYNKVYAGINNATRIGSERDTWKYNSETGARQRIKEVTYKAGNSAGVKKGWLTRLRGGASKVAGNHPLVMGARLMGKTPGGKMAMRAGGAAKKFAGTERGKKIIKGALIGGAIVGGTALAIGAARSKSGRSAFSKLGKAVASRKRTGPVQSSFNRSLSEHLKPTVIKGPSKRSRASEGLKRAGEFITGRGGSHGTKWTQTTSIPGVIKKVGRGSKTALVKAASKVNLHKKLKYVSPSKGTFKPYRYGGKEYTNKEQSLDAKLMDIRNQINNATGKDFYTADIYEGYAIVNNYQENKYYKVPYMEVKDGEIQIAGKEKWSEVERSWEECESKEMSLTITKDADDKWRWTLLSTNAFEDRDGEVISQKALETDLEQSEKTYKEVGDYGPLRWWHVVLGDDPVTDGLDIGRCDFRGMEDRIMVESGTFDNEELGEAFAEHSKELGGSVGFKHSTSEPDSDKVFNSIRIFERSLLPRERASNPLAQLIIEKEGGIMVKEKIEKLNAILGGTDKAEKVLGKAKEAQAAAEAEGVRTKEVEKVTTKADEPVVDASDELTQEEWDGFVEAVGTALEQIAEAEENPEVAEETKEFDELKTALKEINDGQGKLADALMKLDTRLKSLEGEQPAGTKFVASESEKTKTKEMPAEPRVDPLNSFMDSFVLKK